MNQINPIGSYQTCNEAEEAVKAAQNQYNDAIQELANGRKDANLMKIVSVKFQSRQEAEEHAFAICNRPD